MDLEKAEREALMDAVERRAHRHFSECQTPAFIGWCQESQRWVFIGNGKGPRLEFSSEASERLSQSWFESQVVAWKL